MHDFASRVAGSLLERQLFTMSALTCGVDIGSTNVKVILVNERARAVWTKSVPTPRVPDDSGVATDVLRLVAMIEEMIIEGWHTLGQSLPLQAIAVVGVGEDGVGVRADLTPIGLSLPWFDERAAMQASVLQRTSRYAAQAGLAIDSSRTAAKWLWLRQNRPADLVIRCILDSSDRLPGSGLDGSPLHERNPRCSDWLLRCVCTLLDRAPVDRRGRPDSATCGTCWHCPGQCSERAAARERSRVYSDGSRSRRT